MLLCKICAPLPILSSPNCCGMFLSRSYSPVFSVFFSHTTVFFLFPVCVLCCVCGCPLFRRVTKYDHGGLTVAEMVAAIFFILLFHSLYPFFLSGDCKVCGDLFCYRSAGVQSPVPGQGGIKDGGKETVSTNKSISLVMQSACWLAFLKPDVIGLTTAVM